MLEKKLDNLDSNRIKAMSLEDFYNFLMDDYFQWKFTDSRWLNQNKNHLARYVLEQKLDELSAIQSKLFSFNLDDIREGLTIASSINGLGIAGGSGLLSLLFPNYFGTVDQFVVKALSSIERLPETNDVLNMAQTNLKINNGVFLITIMRNKASELNMIFHNNSWSPRAIDKVLWAARNA